jgi:peptidoglycan/xylan/chitin deacetylase (PgdA/CDA1 family)
VSEGPGRRKAGILVVAMLFAAQAGAATHRRVAMTFDDLPGNYAGNCNVGALRQMNQQLVAAIQRNHMPALAVVNEGKLCVAKRGQLAPLLTIWLNAGLDLGNHTYSHVDFNNTSLADFEKDIIDGEKTVRPLLASRGKTLRYFRFPFLRMGKDLPKKRAIEDFLRKRGYENAIVTIDDDDYIYAVAYANADAATKKRLAADYIRYMESMFAFYEKFSGETLGYEPPQILLLHDHQLNADTLDALAAMIRRRGYSFISVADAMHDPVYKRTDNYIGGYGISWIHRWAMDDGKPAPGQPDVPPWIMDLYHATGR